MKAKISQDGKMAQVVNPYRVGSYEWNEWNKADNPPLPLTKDHTPCEIVEVRKVWQYRQYPHSAWVTEDSYACVTYNNRYDLYLETQLHHNKEARQALEVAPIAHSTTKEEYVARPFSAIDDKVEPSASVETDKDDKQLIPPELWLKQRDCSNSVISHPMAGDQYVRSVSDAMREYAECAVSFIIQREQKDTINSNSQQGVIELLEKAFEAGVEFNNNCTCGECDYCADKSSDAPDFKTWLKQLNNGK